MQAKSASQSLQSYQVSGLCRGQDWTTIQQNTRRFSNPRPAITPIRLLPLTRRHQSPPQCTEFQFTTHPHTLEFSIFVKLLPSAQGLCPFNNVKDSSGDKTRQIAVLVTLNAAGKLVSPTNLFIP